MNLFYSLLFFRFLFKSMYNNLISLVLFLYISLLFSLFCSHIVFSHSTFLFYLCRISHIIFRALRIPLPCIPRRIKFEALASEHMLKVVMFI